MKSMLEKLQTLGAKAAQIKQVVDTAPGKIAEMREALTLTAGQLQAARSELQQVATGLHVENDQDFSAAFREIAQNHNVFHDAGYDLTGIDMEVSHGQRLIVHLQRLASVPEQTLKSLLSQHSSHVTISSILSSIIKAGTLTAKVATPGLEYTGLMVQLGSAPAVRVLWRDTNHPPVAAMVTNPATVTSAPTPLPRTSPAPAATSNFAQSNFFERSATPTTAPSLNVAPAVEHVVASPLPSSRPAFAPAKSLSGDWKKDAMERLKNSPGTSKYGA